MAIDDHHSVTIVTSDWILVPNSKPKPAPSAATTSLLVPDHIPIRVTHASPSRRDKSVPKGLQGKRTSPNGSKSRCNFRPTRPPHTGPRILALDGGGCRGYLTLLVLHQLLRLVQPEGLIYPYQYFDLICGTSTGGLIAILLAVLHLDIETVIEIYALLAGKVFAKGFSIFRFCRKDAGYSRKPLEAAIDEILKQHGGDRALMMDPDRDKGCRSFVTTTHFDGVRRDVVLARSYEAPTSEQGKHYDHPWTIREAALATSAAPTYFNRYAIAVGGKQAQFEDAGAHHANNPAKLAWKECQSMPDLKGESTVFISLGTGSAPRRPSSGLFGFFKNKIDTFKAWVEYATDVHKVDEQMKRKADGSQAPQKMFYFRLNPSLAQKIKLDDWKKLPEMKQIAEKFYSDNRDHFDAAADKLRDFRKAR